MARVGRELFGPLGSAISDYGLIGLDDRILMGISGGKDSLFMAWALSDIRKRSPVKFSLEAITINPGEPWEFPESGLDSIRQFLAGLDIPYHVVPTNIARIVTRHHGRKTECSLCSNLRRGYLYKTASDLGVTKVALAHHLDDAIETLLLNMFYQGKFRCFRPKTFLSRRNVEVIRPMVYLEEERISRASSTLGLPVMSPTCSVTGTTCRQSMKALVSGLSSGVPGLRTQMRNILKAYWMEAQAHTGDEPLSSSKKP